MITILDASGFERLLATASDRGSVVFDLSQLKFVKPHGTVALLLLLVHLRAMNRRVTIRPPVNLKVVDYLKDVGFFLEARNLAYFDELPPEYFSTDFEPRETMQVVTRIRTHQDVRPISDRFAYYLEQDLRFSKELVDEMWAVMVEMIENVPHHAYPGVFRGPVREGFVNMQYLPNVKKLYFSVGDLGVGIRGSLEGQGVVAYSMNSDAEVIRKVMESQRLSSLGRKRGGGINVTALKVKEFGGWMAIRSDTGYVVQNPRGVFTSFDNLRNLPGTQVSIHIPARPL